MCTDKIHAVSASAGDGTACLDACFGCFVPREIANLQMDMIRLCP